MDTWNQSLTKLLASYEDSIQTRQSCRVEEDQEADETLASTLQKLHDNLATDLEKLDNEQIELKDRIMTLHDEILANLDAIDDRYRQSEGLKDKAKALKDTYMRESEEVKQELDRKRAREDREHRAVVQAELVCPLFLFPTCTDRYKIGMIEVRPVKKPRCSGSYDNSSSASPTVSTVASCQSQ
ncbi:hypothetical protein FDECE_14283 [Fusarium decemcellulare]|nr:hypothetical protein FDECE_14283 [Fusarium decemcellulare]